MKRQRVSITLTPEELAVLDARRGLATRTAYVAELTRNAIAPAPREAAMDVTAVEQKLRAEVLKYGPVMGRSWYGPLTAAFRKIVPPFKIP